MQVHERDEPSVWRGWEYIRQRVLGQVRVSESLITACCRETQRLTGFWDTTCKVHRCTHLISFSGVSLVQINYFKLFFAIY